MEIKIPKRQEDLRIHHFRAFKEWNEEKMETMDKARFVAAFTGLHIRGVLAIDNDDFNKVYDQIIKVLTRLNIADNPPQEIELNGQIYSMIDPHKTSAGWHMDWGELVKNGGFEKDTVRCACLFYHPKGEGYGEIDINSNLKHSIKDKYELFKNELPLSTFIEASRFFLLKSTKSINTSMERRIWEIKAEKLIRRIPFLRGKK